jgi:hypothetical protein
MRGGLSPTPARGFSPTSLAGAQISDSSGIGRRSTPGRVSPAVVSLASPGSGSTLR